LSARCWAVNRTALHERASDRADRAGVRQLKHFNDAPLLVCGAGETGLVDSDDLGAPRWVQVDQLVTATEIAQRLGITPVAWHSWVQSPSVTVPAHVHVVTAKNIRLWLWPEVERWAIRNGLLNTPFVETPDGVDDLMTATEVSQLVGWTSVGTPYQQHKHGTFPAPVGKFGQSWVWRRSDVRAWIAAHPRGPSGRRKSRGSL